MRSSLIGVAALLALPPVAWSADALPSAPAPAVRPAAGSQSALPAPLDGLAAQVAGVVGSGDKLSLVLRQGETSRTLKVGDSYQDDWMLTALTADVATFTKAGQSRQVGLNPDGAMAQRDLAGAAQVTTVGRQPDPAALATLMQGLAAGRGMSAADAQQLIGQAQAYMSTPAGQAAVAAGYDRAVAQYGQGAIDSFLAGQGRGGAAILRAAPGASGGQ